MGEWASLVWRDYLPPYELVINRYNTVSKTFAAFTTTNAAPGSIAASHSYQTVMHLVAMRRYRLLGRNVVALLGESASTPLNNHPRRPVSRLDTLLDLLPLRKLREEPANERVARAVRVHEQLRGERVDVVLSHDAARRDNRAPRALREHDGARANTRRLGHLAHLERDLLEVLPVVPKPVLLAVSLGLGLVREDKVGEGEGGGDLVAEEVNDEGGGEVEAERLAVVDAVLSYTCHVSMREQRTHEF